MIQRNPTFEKVLALLAHPLTLAALGLLLLNDSLLRQFWPSWWTGKLSDLAWMVVTPFFLAALLAWLVPGKKGSVQHERWTFGLAFFLIAAGFSLAKLSHPVNLLATRLLTQAFDRAPALAFDPSDLLALPGLLLAFWLWQRTNHAAAPATRLANTSLSARAVRGLVLLPLTALLLLADAAAPDMGIVCFARPNGDSGPILAANSYGKTFESRDGGKTWAFTEEDAGCKRASMGNGETLDAPGPQPDVIYRYHQAEYIQRSTDGGKTFNQIYQVVWDGEVQRIYNAKVHQGNPMYIAGPYDATADKATGNMLFAMGHDGVLVLTPQDQWVWSQGGDYYQVQNFPDAYAVLVLLGSMFILALELAALIYLTLGVPWLTIKRRWMRIVSLVILWAGWLGLDIVFPPATMVSYAMTISVFGMIILGVLLLIALIVQTIQLMRQNPGQQVLPQLLIISLGGGLVYLVPYFLWVYNVTRWGFETTTIVGVVLIVIVLAAGWFILRRKPLQAAPGSAA